MRSPPAAPQRRPGFGRALVELHYQLRTEGDTALRSAAAVFLGTLVGCMPLYGLHLALCTGLAKLLGVSRLKAYLASHINNPLTAPFLLALEFGLGRWLYTGHGPGPLREAFRGTTVMEVGRELLTGSLLVGLSAGLLLALGSLVIRRRRRSAPAWERVCAETARRYLEAGVLHWEFVRGKLRYDPLYRDVLTSGVLPGDGVLRDLGCGRGILLALIQVSAESYARGEWLCEGSPPPHNLVLSGVERHTGLASIARKATGDRARIDVEDLERLTVAPAQVILLLDVLHYLAASDQESLIRRASAALAPGGVMLIREPDAGRPVRFLVTRLSERLCSVLRREAGRRLHYRTAAAWCALLSTQGLVAKAKTSWGSTPFANVLIRCERPLAQPPRPAP